MVMFYKGQKYSSIIRNASNGRNLFNDTTFPCDGRLLGEREQHERLEVSWLRPTQLSQSPSFVTDSPTFFISSSQRKLSLSFSVGDCRNNWLLNVAVALWTYKPYWNFVFPDIKSQNYRGNELHPEVFRFRAFDYGTPFEIVIDSQLPCVDGRPLYNHNSQSKEFWLPLFEKSLAKLYHSYEILHSVRPGELLANILNYSLEPMPIEQTFDADQIKYVKSHLSRGSVVFCQTDSTTLGLVAGSYYLMTDVRSLVGPGRVLTTLLKLVCPSGSSPWTGAWSHCSTNWAMSGLSAQERLSAGLVFHSEAEFWLDLAEFRQWFCRLEIVFDINWNPAGLLPSAFVWKTTGKWPKSAQFHGSINSFSPTSLQSVSESADVASSSTDQLLKKNPQFMMVITAPEGQVLLSLVQKLHSAEGTVYTPVRLGFLVFRVQRNRRCLMHTSEHSRQVLSSKPSRELSHCVRAKLSSGRYVLVPYCLRDVSVPLVSDLIAQFVLRVRAEKSGRLVRLERSYPPRSLLRRRFAQLVTVIRFESLDNLDELMPELVGSARPVFLCLSAKCGRETVHFGKVKVTDGGPVLLDESAIFYKHNAKASVKLVLHRVKRLSTSRLAVGLLECWDYELSVDYCRQVELPMRRPAKTQSSALCVRSKNVVGDLSSIPSAEAGAALLRATVVSTYQLCAL